MTISEFESKYLMYENMAIWEIKSLDHFFEDDEMLQKIFLEEYKFPYSELDQHKDSFTDTPIMVVSRLLDYFGDKYFFVFENNNAHHDELKRLQDQKIINFGMDIYVLNPERIYVLMLDKSKNPAVYDTI